MGETLRANSDPKKFVDWIDKYHADLLSLRGSYMADCKVVRNSIKDVYKEADDAGIPKKALKAVISARQLEAKAKAERDDLGDLDLQSRYDDIRKALGDFANSPLGQAAVAQAQAAA